MAEVLRGWRGAAALMAVWIGIGVVAAPAAVADDGSTSTPTTGMKSAVVRGKTVFRHTVSNAPAVLAVLRHHRFVLALGGHIHAVEHLEYEVEGVRTRFNQSSAIVAPSEEAGMRFLSGVTVYTVRRGEIDAGRFIPLGSAELPRP